MISLPAGTRLWIVAGVTDMRRGFMGLAGIVQTALAEKSVLGTGLHLSRASWRFDQAAVVVG